MKKVDLLLVFFLLVCVEVVESVVQGLILSVNLMDTNGTNATGRPCKKDRCCGQGHYCHKHNGLCHSCKGDSQKCRRNKMCCDGMECVFGHCRVAKLRGSVGGRCRKDRPKCDAGLCCANAHGLPICKKLLQEGEDCGVPDGGLEYSLNQKCQCGPGLVCKKVKHSHKKRLVGRRGRKKWVCQRL
ncbi:dickkopf-related protein 3-like [Acropora muricata]|uniref:dickkopf-related protein 3-like n=1 Tax=Acropora muricata TaxID=159855 RepID=UPI0034E57657